MIPAWRIHLHDGISTDHEGVVESLDATSLGPLGNGESQYRRSAVINPADPGVAPVERKLAAASIDFASGVRGLRPFRNAHLQVQRLFDLYLHAARVGNIARNISPLGDAV